MKSIILIGDSIRGGYQETVIRELQDEAQVWAPVQNCGPSTRILENLDEWVLGREADIVHLNCGLHDVVHDPADNEAGFVMRVPLEDYARNVREIIGQIQRQGKTVVWATCTPVREPARCEADVDAYNAAALAVVRDMGVAVDDLFSAVEAIGRDKLLTEDGVHFTPEGSEVLGRIVADFLRRLL